METTTTRPRPRRSVKLTRQEMTAFKGKITELGTKYDAALFFGFSQVTLDNVLMRGSAKESTVITIREKLGIAA